MVKSLFGFGPSVDISIQFEGEESRPVLQANRAANTSTDKSPCQIFVGDEAVKGTIIANVPSGKKVEHVGVKVEMVGQIEMFFDKGNNYEFTASVRELDQPGVLEGNKIYTFDFSSVEKQYDSYRGMNVRLRYFVRVTITRSYASNVVQEKEFCVQNLGTAPDINNTIKMEVGIEDCLHIEFEYNKSKYHLNDVVVGKIYFLLVRIKIRHMELAIIRRESAGSGSNVYNESETITKYEIMDGAPVRGESIPVRLFLTSFDLTPTFRSINNKFSVKYFLNLVLVDEEDRRYFKQQEITLWRKTIG